MTWTDIRGHAEIVEQLRHSAKKGRLAGTYLFAGPAGIGKRTFATKLAQSLLCEVNSEAALNPCGHCPACQQVTALSHPDLEVISKPPDKSLLPLELLIGDREHRMQEGLCHRISLKPSRGGRKVAIIDDADYLNQEGANALLKTLEEPPARAVLILITTSAQRQLPTVRSRCQILRFQPLSFDDVVEVLLSREYTASREEAETWAALGDGSVSQALAWSEAGLREFREQFLNHLADNDLPSYELAKFVSTFVEEAGKEASDRRNRLRHVLTIANAFYRQLCHVTQGLPATGDPVLAGAVTRLMNSGWSNSDTAASCLERCMEAETQVYANAQPVTIIECWIDEVAQMSLPAQRAPANLSSQKTGPRR
jgi:DNA polymerase-3 subunit delta'